MYLNNLSLKEKELFLELADFFAKADEKVLESEQMLISAFRKEMNLSEDMYHTKDLSFSEILSGFSESSKATQKSVFIEAIAVAIVDEDIHIKEMEYLEILRENFKIQKNDFQKVLKLISEMNDIYKSLDRFILDGVQIINASNIEEA